MQKIKLRQMDYYEGYETPELRNRIRFIINEELNINSHEYQIYMMEGHNEMVILLFPDIEKPHNINPLREKIQQTASNIVDIDVITAEEYQSAYFEIERVEHNPNIKVDLTSTISAEISVVTVGNNKQEELILHILNDINSNTQFDSTFLSIIQPTSWSDSDTELIDDKEIQHMSIRETTQLFQHHFRNEKDYGFPMQLHQLLDYFESTMQSKQIDSLRKVFFQSSPSPYASYFAATPFCKYVNIKLYLLLYVTFKQFQLHAILDNEDIRQIKRKSSRKYIEYLDRLEAGKAVNSPKLVRLLQNYTMQELRMVLTIKKPTLTEKITDALYTLYEPSDGAKRVYLNLMGFGRQ